MRRWHVLLGLVALLAAVGCEKPHGIAVADAAGPLPESDAARAVIERIKSQFTVEVTVRGAIGGRRSQRLERGAALAPAMIDHFDQVGARLVPRFGPLPLAKRTRAAVLLGKTAADPFAIEDLDSGMAITVALDGARSVSAEMGHGYAVYRAAHGSGADIVHRVVPDGSEDYVVFVRRPDDEVLRYTVTLGDRVAGLRLVENTLEFIDAKGFPRLRVAPPTAVAAEGSPLAAILSVAGCDVDQSPLPSFRRPPTPIGASTCQVTVSWRDSGSHYPLLVDPRWTATHDMVVPRYDHIASLLNDGTVLVAGGVGVTGVLSSAEVYDSAADVWSTTWPMKFPQTEAGAVLLHDGRVLVTGGAFVEHHTMVVCLDYLNRSSEIFDPKSGWSSTSPMVQPRSDHTASLLDDGRVLIAGGEAECGEWVTGQAGILSDTELYDSAHDVWYRSSDMGVARAYHQAANLAGGKVLVAGGPSGSAEVFDPLARGGLGAWSAVHSMAAARSWFAMTAMSPGSVLAVGGDFDPNNNGHLLPTTAELYDVANNQWSPAGSLLSGYPTEAHPLSMVGQTSSLLPSGRVVVAGGMTDDSRLTWILDGQGGWLQSAPLTETRSDHTATVLADQARVLIAGGVGRTFGDLRLYGEIYQVPQCYQDGDCKAGHCVDFVCCDTACGGNNPTDCWACSVGTGAEVDGTCAAVVDGTSCSLIHASGVCGTGACAFASCSTGFGDCNNNLADGCETDTTTDAGNCGACAAACVPGQLCQSSQCACTQQNLFLCSKQCIDPLTDALNCGACGDACSANNVQPLCSMGSCQGSCVQGFADCDNNKLVNGCESNVSSDLQNCGACGSVCSSSHVVPSCVQGVCAGACIAPWGDCNSNRQVDGCEANLTVDDMNCGACDAVCPTYNVAPLCGMGLCQGQCSAGFEDCDNNKLADGCETSLLTDARNCGGCGVACSDNNVQALCAMGACQGTCFADYADCNQNKQLDGCEANLTSDPRNCGACGVACGAGTRCVGGHCLAVQGTTTCGGLSVNPATDPMNCGGCGIACGIGLSCIDAQCCAPGSLACLGFCRDPSSDLHNCGSCGHACSPFQTCQNGQCTCGQGLVLCAGSCVNPATDGQNCGGCGVACAGGQVCQNSLCVAGCPQGLVSCNGVCVNPATDAQNCGGCGLMCISGQTCQNALCVAGCAQGFTSCGGLCVNFSTDAQNCGSCMHACAQGQVCQNGLCAGGCAQGLLSCNGNCVNPATDSQNCGGCGRVCAPGSSCQNGQCAPGCPQGQLLCGGLCVNPATDSQNCGGCALPCAQGQTCQNGQCAPGCPKGQLLCGGICVHPASDVQNCGGCANSCPNGQPCQNGQCVVGCAQGQLLCGGVCVNPATDSQNCGGCALPCAQGQTCQNAKCVGGCAAGLVSCGGVCANFATDPQNCGACAHACGPGQICQAGQCACQPGLISCNGSCVNQTIDAQNCGACGLACGPGLACLGGQCGCANGLTHCHGGCTDPAADIANCGGCGLACPPGWICQNGLCAASCPPGQVHCNGACSDLTYDSRNCGQCGNACSQGFQCAAGLCSCSSGLTQCGSACDDLSSDPANCGACGNPCPFGQQCAGGQCACVPGMQWCGGACKDVLRDPRNCGACANVCGADFACAVGNCICRPGFTDCGGRCVDLVTDTNNCGACGNACAASFVCQNGCVCPAPQVACNNVCTNIAADIANCGGCGNACSRNNVQPGCVGGACSGACNIGFADCNQNRLADGCETSTGANNSNCGACGNLCPNGTVCQNGLCTPCPPSLSDCGGICVDESGDAKNCGACGSICPPNQSCALSRCTCAPPSMDCGVSGCTDVKSDIANCGTCYRPCSTNHITPACIEFGCVGTCDPGFADCNGDTTYDGCETVTDIDPDHCGACNTACSSNHILRQCSGGTCDAGACSAGYGDCNLDKKTDGCETELLANNANCGACGLVCGPQLTCQWGQCLGQPGAACAFASDCLSVNCNQGVCQ